MADEFVDVQEEFEAVQKAFVEWYRANIESRSSTRAWEALNQPLPHPKVIYEAADIAKWDREQGTHSALETVAHDRMLASGQVKTTAEYNLLQALKLRGSWYKVSYGFVRRNATGNIQFVSHDELLDQLMKGG